MHPLITKVEAKYLKDDLIQVSPGDTVRVSIKVREEDKERVQNFEGVIIAMSGEGLFRMVKVRKISYGVGVERTFPLHSPSVLKIEVLRRGAPRRAKLYYLRDRVGRQALRVKERVQQRVSSKKTAAKTVTPAAPLPETPKNESADAVDTSASKNDSPPPIDKVEKSTTTPDQ